MNILLAILLFIAFVGVVFGGPVLLIATMSNAPSKTTTIIKEVK